MEGERHLAHDLESPVDPLAEQIEDEMLRLALGHLARVWELEGLDDAEG